MRSNHSDWAEHNADPEMASQPAAGGEENLYDSVQELKMKLETMKRMMDGEEEEDDKTGSRRKRRNNDSIIDGSFLSFVFVFVLILIVCVSFYAFSNLYYAVLKKFPGRKHTEL